jgi:hypothetical protein
MAAALVGALLELYAHVLSALPATPARFHYLFNPRDLSRVLEGLLLSTAPRCAAPDAFVRLWRNECLRVFHDRLICDEDKQARPALPSAPPGRQTRSASQTRALDSVLCQWHERQRPCRQARASSALAAPSTCSTSKLDRIIDTMSVGQGAICLRMIKSRCCRPSPSAPQARTPWATMQ